MFKKSRIKIITSIMSILVLLWAGTLAVIYTSSYYDMKKQYRQMLTAHAEMHSLSGAFNEMMPPNKPKPNNDRGFDAESPMFRLSTFYTVAISYDGTIIEIKNEAPTIHSDEDLSDLALNIFSSTQDFSKENNLTFYKTDKGGYILIAFMDNTVVNENAVTLLRYTFIFGGAAIIVFFFISLFLARSIVKPLEDNHKKQKQFISDAGHELKTPVSIISANAELLSREVGQSQWLQNIQYENERMAMLIGQLLDLAKTEGTEIAMEHINFSRIAAGESLPFESVCFEKGLTLASSIQNDIYVLGNHSQLKQIISILLDNAVRHCSGQNEISLTLTRERGFARLCVINGGKEIPPDKQEQLFERFYRMDEARNGDDGHYGLGLSIAKAITYAHKGQISVQCYNGLVEFTVLIPLGQ